MIGLAFYYRSDPETHSVLKLVTHEYLLLNGLLFIVWVINHFYFPWFIFPVLVLGLPIAITYVSQVYSEKRKWVYVGIVSIDVGIMVFLIWGFTQAPFPWFIFVWIPLALICGVFWYFGKGEVTYADMDKGDEESPEIYYEENVTAQPQLYPNVEYAETLDYDDYDSDE
eukprot:TRINITY_DN5743_c0_g1_i2.p1 TRINITY_DN5743_c0_g1~~TRINITY_DN5743_c0_g1_i2.p1  ORF type:complete len:169 (+),score=29.97 TRINITY_DN5743_c0_g1_i2:519-1025(+)